MPKTGGILLENEMPEVVVKVFLDPEDQVNLRGL